MMIKIVRYANIDLKTVLQRGENTQDVSAAAAEVIAAVRKDGDKAVFEYTRRFDGADLDDLEVSDEEWNAGISFAEPEFIKILERAARNIEAFHKNQIRPGFVTNGTDGAVMGQKIVPLRRVGLYIPGGTAAYPSSALMNTIPAKLAGVPEIFMASPPGAGGVISPYILAAARIAGVDRVFKMGGAQAVAAFAYGTESVPRVDKITGPGNAYVAEAKRQVFGAVGIDMIAGPSDVCIIADASAPASYVAADMLAQAEHDPNARAVLLTDSEKLAYAAAVELGAQLNALPRSDIAAASIRDNGLVVICRSIDEAVGVANELAPEHLEIMTENAFDYLDKIHSASSVFIGKNTPEALGDYMSGPNHTMPTLGMARFASPLSVDDFTKKVSFSYFSRGALERVGADVRYFAEKEGLHAHAKSVALRLEDK